MQIQQATISDLELLQRISIESYHDTFAASNTKEDMDLYLAEAFNKDIIRRELEEPLAVSWLAYLNGSPAGYARMRVTSEVVDQLGQHAIEIHRMYALKDFIGQGVGQALMRQCLHHAQSGKFEWVWLGVWEKNYKAQDFYRKWGFEKFGEHPFVMGNDPQIDWLMKKRL